MLYLTLLLAVPMVGVLFIVLIPGNQGRAIRAIAIVHAVVTLAIAWGLIFLFDSGTAGVQFAEHFKWHPRMDTYYSLGLDGFSFPMVLLATLLCLIALIASGNIRERVKAYYMLMLVLESAMLGVFLARDWTLFYLFWELTLIPLFFLIDRWGGKKRQTASINFVLYTLGGSVFMLISILLLYDALPAKTFDMTKMAAGAKSLDDHKQVLIFLGLLIGFGVKMPIFPIHGWLPLAHVEAPSPVSILLSGILLKMGAYGLIRAAETLPKAMIELQTILAAIAFVSILYGGLLAWRQVDLKKMIAYSSVSHMGVVLLGIATLNITGLTGALAQMIAHGLVAGMMFLLIGLLYERTRTRDVNEYSSLVRSTPRFAFFTILAFIAAVGLPGTAGFIAELHTLVGGYERWGWIIVLLSLSVMVSAAYAIRTVGRLFTGPVRDSMKDVQDLRASEFIAASILAAGVIYIGVFPAATLDMMSGSISKLGSLFSVRP